MTSRFLSPLPKLIVVEGRNLLRICADIQWHRMPWVRVADRDFGNAAALLRCRYRSRLER